MRQNVKKCKNPSHQISEIFRKSAKNGHILILWLYFVLRYFAGFLHFHFEICENLQPAAVCEDALSYATQHTALQHEDVVQDRVDKYMHEELGKMRTGYLIDLEAKMDSAIAGLHMPTRSSGARRAASPARHG